VEKTSEEPPLSATMRAGWMARVAGHPFAFTVIMVAALVTATVTSYLPLKDNQFITLYDPAYIKANPPMRSASMQPREMLQGFFFGINISHFLKAGK